MPKTLIIIPCYNEEDNIIQLAEVMLKDNDNADVLVVDDGSDSTADLVREKQKSEPRLFLIKRQGKGGRGSAVLEGFKFALARDYQRIAEMDADFSHDPKDFKAMTEASGDNVMVIGSRDVRGSRIAGWPLWRKLLHRGSNIYANLVLGVGIHDYTNGYKLYGRQAIEKLDISNLKSVGFILNSEIAYNLYKRGVEIVEVPTFFVNRTRGKSTLSLKGLYKELTEAFFAVLKIRWNYKS